MKRNLIIFSGFMARELLRKGYTIVDVKANKTEPLASVFVFKNEDGLEELVRELSHKESGKTFTTR